MLIQSVVLPRARHAVSRSISAQQFVDARLRARLRVDLLHDDRAVQLAVAFRRTAGCRRRRPSPPARGRRSPRPSRDCRSCVLWPMNTPMPSTEFSSTITPSTTSERAPMKQLSSMIVGLACSGSKHPADADAARQVHVLADLRARAHGRPGVDHGAFVDVGADVHVARASARRCGAMIGAAARDRRRHHAHARLRERGVVVLRELGRHLVVEAEGHVRSRRGRWARCRRAGTTAARPSSATGA